MSLSTSQLQSLIAVNAKQIDATNIFYQSYKDILKDFRECGKSDDSAYARYVKAKDKELRKMHLLEKNQKALKQALALAYEQEDFVKLTFIYESEEGAYA